jgi:hypothetical protein
MRLEVIYDEDDPACRRGCVRWSAEQILCIGKGRDACALKRRKKAARESA